MKTYPYPTGRIKSGSLKSNYKKLLLFILFILLTIFSFAGGGLLNFKNSTLESGVAGQDGAIYRFPLATVDFDALVKINGRSDALTYLVNIDMNSSGFDKAWQPQVGYNNGSAPGAGDWWMEFDLTFVKKGTIIPVNIDEFDMSAIDIDGNGRLISEYVSFYGLNSYVLETPSLLTVSDIFGTVSGVTGVVGKRFDGPTQNFRNIDTNGTAVMVTSKYLNTQTFTIRTGGVSTGPSSASERMYSLYFKEFRYTAPQQVTLPVSLTSFDAKLVSGKAELSWSSGLESNFSHFVIERSYDGKEYDDITMVFSNGQHGSDASYSYSENIKSATSGIVYYRLKMVDNDGSFKYSYIRILKLNMKNEGLAITTYPNPVASELRITIPAKWQDQKVVYDMFSSNGQMVKRYVANKASQTETLYLNDINAGTYVIKLSSGNESAMQQIIKSR
jgi:hypothetical protein